MKFIQFVLVLLLSHGVIADDAVTMADKISDKSEHLFYTREFESINKMDELFRTSQSRLPDGRWKLTFIYSELGAVSRRGAEAEWQQKLRLVNEWINRTPNHAAPYLAKAEILIAYAWDARGGGWAKTVTESQWQTFHSRLAEARKVLEESSPITGNHPHWFLSMEVIAKGQGWDVESFSKLYDSATDLYPTYYFLHFKAANYFQPRWHGSKQELRRFVENAVNKSKHKEGLTLYTRIYWSQLWALKDKTFAPGYAEWASMKQGFEDIMKDHPGSRWNLNAYAYYACMGNDWKTTNMLIRKIGDNPHLGIWKSKSRFYFCQSLAEKA